jgi:2-methylcitrate dehydratase PrpD
MSDALVDRIGRWAAQFAPAPVREARVRTSIRDFAGCVAAGAPLAELAPALALAADGAVPVWGVGRTFDPAGAALVMGTAGSLLQLHDLHPPSGVHASSPVIPAAWAARALRPSSAGRLPAAGFVRAVAAGYEATQRLALNAAPALARAGGSGTGTAGALGAAVAAARVAGLDADGIARAVSACALLLPATPLATMTAHAPLAALHSGLAARAAVEAVRLAPLGHAGRDVLEGNAGSPGLLTLLRGRPEALAPGQWDGATLDAICWKLFPACFGALTALEALLRLDRVEPGAVRALRVRLPDRMLGLVAHGPHEGHLYDRLMSLRWVLARALETGGCEAPGFTAPSAVADEIARRIVVGHDPALDALQDAWAADLELETDAGCARIDWRRPMSDTPPTTGPRGWTAAPDDPALRAKFDRLAAGCPGLPASLAAILPTA